MKSAARIAVSACPASGGAIIAMRSFGLLAPGPVAQVHFGFDVAHVVAAARQQLARLAPAA